MSRRPVEEGGKRCHRCGGKGKHKHTGVWIPCEWCQGTGVIKHSQDATEGEERGEENLSGPRDGCDLPLRTPDGPDEGSRIVGTAADAEGEQGESIWIFKDGPASSHGQAVRGYIGPQPDPRSTKDWQEVVPASQAQAAQARVEEREAGDIDAIKYWKRRAEAAESRSTELEGALREAFNLAAVSTDGDPWYAEQEGLDAEAVYDKARKALTPKQEE